MLPLQRANFSYAMSAHNREVMGKTGRVYFKCVMVNDILLCVWAREVQFVNCV
jgi:hypothetical protein